MEEIYKTTKFGGLRKYDLGAAESVVSSLSLGLCRKYHKQIQDGNMCQELLDLAVGNEGAMLEALFQRIKLLEKQGRSKATFNVAREFEVCPVKINFVGKSGKGISTHISGSKDVDVECVAGIASHASKKLGGFELEQTKLARRVAALVKQKEGSSCRAQITTMPRLLRGVDYSSKGAALARAVDGHLTGLVRGVMTDFSTAANVSQILYTRPPEEMVDFISEHQGFKYFAKKLDVEIEPFETEQANKKAIKEMLNVYPGHRTGPGNLAASHMDGIPVTGKMRTMLDHVQDFHYRDADIYFFAGSKSQVYTSIYQSILEIRQKNENSRPFLVTYVSDNDISQRVLSKFVEVDERGDVKKVLKSAVICGKMTPRAGPGVTSYYVDFSMPEKASKDKISLEADTARKTLLDRVSAVKGYTYYQIYCNYLAMSFPIDYKKDEEYEIRDAATWDEKERYIPSVLGRRGICIYTGTDVGIDAIAMSKMMINMIYHSIIYVFIGQHKRQYGEFVFSECISVDFSLVSTIKTVSSVITGGLIALGDALGDKFRECIDEKIAERDWKQRSAQVEIQRLKTLADKAKVERLAKKVKEEVEEEVKEELDGGESADEQLELVRKKPKKEWRVKKEKKISALPSVKEKASRVVKSNFGTEDEVDLLFGET